jgi:nitrogen-specific signal transduction histidine kinase
MAKDKLSTRKTGSGIGLSLCKQIMMLDKGYQSGMGRNGFFTFALMKAFTKDSPQTVSLSMILP